MSRLIRTGCKATFSPLEQIGSSSPSAEEGAQVVLMLGVRTCSYLTMSSAWFIVPRASMFYC